MNVLYDVGNLGRSSGASFMRTGIFRVTEAMVKAILAHPGVDPRFAAMDSWANEVQLARYDRSAGGLLGARRVSAWDNAATTMDDAVALFDRLLAGEPDGPAAARLRAEVGLLNRVARARRVPGSYDVYHSWRQPLVPPDRVAARVRVATIHDMIPSLFPEMTLDSTLATHESVLRSVDVERDWILTLAESTRADIANIMGMPADRIFVVPLAASRTIFRPEPDADRRRSVLARHGISGNRYVLSLCTLEPRKNLARLVNAFAAMAQEPALRDVRLVLVGAVGWKTEALFERIAAHHLPADRLLLPGFVPDEDLSALYASASVFVFPSLYEGFGLPALEAMQCGAPVVTSRTSSLPEVVGDAAVLVDPLDEEAIAQAMRDVLEDGGLSDVLRRRGLERARRFTWQRSADETVGVYRAIFSRGE